MTHTIRLQVGLSVVVCHNFLKGGKLELYSPVGALVSTLNNEFKILVGSNKTKYTFKATK